MVLERARLMVAEFSRLKCSIKGCVTQEGKVHRYICLWGHLSRTLEKVCNQTKKAL